VGEEERGGEGARCLATVFSPLFLIIWRNEQRRSEVAINNHSISVSEKYQGDRVFLSWGMCEEEREEETGRGFRA